MNSDSLYLRIVHFVDGFHEKRFCEYKRICIFAGEILIKTLWK